MPYKNSLNEDDIQTFLKIRKNTVQQYTSYLRLAWHLTHYRRPTTAPPWSTINNTIATHWSTTIRPTKAWFKEREREREREKKKKKKRYQREKKREEICPCHHNHLPTLPQPPVHAATTTPLHHLAHAVWFKIH